MKTIKELIRMSSPSMYVERAFSKADYFNQLEKIPVDMTAFKRKPYYMTVNTGGVK